MFTYFGSKSKLAHRYPRPEHDTIVEPFAGSAQYSLLYHYHNVILIEKDEVIFKLWKWLQQAQPRDVLSIPDFDVGDDIREHKFESEGQQILCGFLAYCARSRPFWKFSSRGAIMQRREKQRIAANLCKIRGWDIRHGSYLDAENIEATWYVDPPYIEAGREYRCSLRADDYRILADWCRSRRGQVIVCEADGADWLPFSPIGQASGSRRATREAVFLQNSADLADIYIPGKLP